MATKIILLTTVVVIVFLGIAWALGNTVSSIQQLKKLQFNQSSQAANRALPIVKGLSALTLHQIPDLEVWQNGLLILATTADLSQQLPPILDHSDSPSVTSKTLADLANPIISELTLIDQSLPHTILIKRLMPVQQQTAFHQFVSQVTTISQSVLTGPQTWLVIFQNSQELRATGGFMGSLAYVTTTNGSITGIDVQDIYQPDGQFTGFLSPPPGVKEYLSGGKSWRLPDLNWSPDFPVSATQITQYLLQAHQPLVAGVIAINLDMIQQLLKVTGPMYVPDYQTTITADTIGDSLRQNRDQFFPGSVAKQHLLASFLIQLKLKLRETSPSLLWPVLKTAAATQTTMAFSPNQNLEAIFQNWGVAGTLPSVKSNDLYIVPVESNVGINKANRGIERSMKLELGDTQSTLTTRFENTNPATASANLNPLAESPELQYVNYQRYLIKPDTHITAITYQGQPITKWDEDLVTTSLGETLDQIGFLITVSTQSTGTLVVTFSHPTLAVNSQILFGKQPGTGPLVVTLTGFGHSLATSLTQTLTTSPQAW